MAESSLTFASTETFRNTLMSKNLAPYNVPGVYSPSVSQLTYETNLSNYNVIDSPDTFITQDPFAQQLYPLNQYGPQNGYNLNINFNGPPLPVPSNQGLYTDVTDTKLDLLNEANIDAAYLENAYGPDGGFNNLVIITDLQNPDKIHQPYWSPPSFEPSTYSPYDIITNTNPVGDSGPLSNDSFIAKLGAERLRFAFQQRIGAEIYQATIGSVNLSSLQDPFEATLLATGQRPLLRRDYTITVPEFPINRAAFFLTKLSSTYVPVSPIPGDYFNENTKGAATTNQTSTALNVVNQLTGGFLGPILNLKRNPSQIFLANTGNGQRSALFNNIDYNRYQPGYDRNFGGLAGIALTAISLLTSLTKGGYYVGSSKSEPENVDSPPNQIPVDQFGRQVAAPVYGPTEMSNLYEGNETTINFGLGAKSTIDGGGIAGSFVWVSPKTKGGAGYKATQGGGLGNIDSEFNLISSDYNKNESTNIKFKKGSILDQTQRLIDSADNVSGISKLKHVGNAINQVSKVFHDGYKEMTKGSQVVSYKNDSTGEEVGIEYCRVFAKDTPYYTYADLQKSAGITKEGRKFSYSVLDSTYNLNIAPTKGEDSTNIVRNEKNIRYAKKYMFSLENLAWRTSSRPGYTYDELPDCEKGPNGGRVMWFPPYDLQFNDTSKALFTPTEFLGRTEPIYTYKNTTRNGSISWKIIVDSPSVLNTLVDKQLKGQTNEKVDSILNSFFAGCVKYDLYTLAKKYNTFSSSELQELQTIVSQQQLTKEEIEGVLASIPAVNTTTPATGLNDVGGSPPKVEVDNSAAKFEEEYIDYAFYFENDEPGVNDIGNYETFYNAYTTDTNITKYQSNADGEFETSSPERDTTDFFNNFVIGNWDKFTKGEESFIKKAEAILKESPENTIQIQLQGAASALASDTYNKKLSERRANSVLEYLKTTPLNDYLGKQFIVLPIVAEGESAVIPKGEFGAGGEIKCTDKIVNKEGKKTNNANIYSRDSMACRRVKIKTVKVKKIPNKEITADDTNQDVIVNESQGLNNEIFKIDTTPKTTVDVRQKLKDGIGKKILRKLLSECDYFEVIKDQTPFIYDSIKEKIKYFNPAFHSTTPEGLNSRLTFLNQCVRPGETIPVIGPDGKPKFNDALNTSFGAPPILVLRIGDFYHTKIVPDTLTITYDPLVYDMNPEGIGVQPMIAKVSLSFSFIGGHGLAKPIEQLQNALSFNYYANTEIYDERAVFTEDTSVLDKEIFNSIVEKETPIGLNDVPVTPERRGGSTIGEIATAVPIEGGEEGNIGYQKIADTTLNTSKQYFTAFYNQAKTIFDQYNYGIWQLITSERQFSKGNFLLAKFNAGDEPEKLEVLIYGKPIELETKLLNLGEMMINDVGGGTTNYIINKMINYGIFDSDSIGKLRNNFIQYLLELISGFDSPIFERVQTFTIFQQDMVQNFRKMNVINSRTDGKILENGNPFVYTINGSDEVYKQTESIVVNTLQEIRIDYSLLGNKYNEFNEFMKEQNLLPSPTLATYPTEKEFAGDFTPLSEEMTKQEIENKRMFMLMARIYTDDNKLEEFKNALLKEGLSDIRKFERKLEKTLKGFKKIVEDEIRAGTKMLQKIKENQKFIDFESKDTYVKGKTRKCLYTTVEDSTTIENQKTLVKNVWSDVNVNSDKATWEGKLKFD